MTATLDMSAPPRPGNGVLLLFLQMPLAAVVGGHLLGVVSLPVASFAVFVSSAAFPAWVSHRTAVSEDPREPVHHLHRYAVVAVGLVTVCTVAVAAASAVTGVGSSGLWRGLGAELTGEPSSGSWALLAGVVVCTLVATCSVTSAQVLFGRRLGLGRPALMDPAARAFDVPTIVEGVVAVSGATQSPTRDGGAGLEHQLALPTQRVGWRSVLASWRSVLASWLSVLASWLSPRRHRRRQSSAALPMAKDTPT